MALLTFIVKLPWRIVKSVRFRCKSLLATIRAEVRARWNTYRILRRREHGTVLSGPTQSLAEKVSIILSFKATDEERVNMLAAVLNRLRGDVAEAGLTLNVVDASDEPFLSRTKSLIASCGLDTHYKSAPKRLTQAYFETLSQVPQKYFYLQFDDMVSVGLKPDFLESACQLLQKYEGLVDVIPIISALRAEAEPQNNSVRVVSYETYASGKQGAISYDFGFGKLQVPLFVEKIGAYEFGIFVNTQYGFFFNHLIAPVQEYRKRMAWYMDNVSKISVHQIELAAQYRTVGPAWTHIAICLSDVCLLDLDYSHTSEAVRSQNEHFKPIYEALRDSHFIDVAHGAGKSTF